MSASALCSSSSSSHPLLNPLSLLSHHLTKSAGYANRNIRDTLSYSHYQHIPSTLPLPPSLVDIEYAQWLQASQPSPTPEDAWLPIGISGGLWRRHHEYHELRLPQSAVSPNASRLSHHTAAPASAAWVSQFMAEEASYTSSTASRMPSQHALAGITEDLETSYWDTRSDATRPEWNWEAIFGESIEDDIAVDEDGARKRLRMIYTHMAPNQ